MIKFSYNGNGLRNISIEDAIRNVALNGYDGIELSLLKNQLFPFTVNDKQLNSIKNVAADSGIKIACLATGGSDLLSDIPYEPSLITPDKEGRKKRIELLKRSIEIAKYLGSPVMNFASGFKNKEMAADDARKYFIEGVQILLDDCKELILAVEPEPDMFIGTTEAAISAIEEVNSPYFKLNLDIGHVYCSEDEYLNKIEKALDYTVHCHIEDIKNRIHHHQIPGTADIDFSSVFKILKAKGYNNFVSVELFHHADVWQQALSESIKYLKAIDKEIY
ncbi:MAG: sugar phosphate isomerase/epimerase [Clostridia bacterium]|nr:sugar phosphate isomerase/epimerase [Clostridia bacterium]